MFLKNKNILKLILIFLVLSVVVLFLYMPVFKNFFQQDEWAGFANYYSVGYNQYILNSLLPDPGHYVPLFKMVFATEFKFFGFNHNIWVMVSILWHILNSFLVYLLAKKIFKLEWQSITSSILFAVFAAGQQATSWVVANGATQGATTFVILSLIYFFDNKIGLSLVMLVVSMLFKEISIGIFAFIPLIIIFQNYVQKKKMFDKRIFYFLGVTVFYIIFRYLTFLGIFSDVKAPVITESQSKLEILFNIATFPIKAIAQTSIPSFVYLETSKLIAEKLPDGIAGAPATTFFDNFYLKYVFQSLNLLVFIIILLITIFVASFKKNRLTAISVFGLIFVAISSVIYALSPGRSGFVPIIDSRNLYLPSIGIIFFLVGIVSVIKKWKLSVLILFILILFNIIITRLELNKISDVGQDRIKILHQISKDNLKLSNKQIFYIESDTSYYGLPDEIRILPFQSGFGQTLLVWYSNYTDFPKDFYKDHFLWDIDSQGYKEIDGRGFGYFRNFDLLITTLKEYNLPVDSVIAYSWNSKESKLTNITEVTRSKLKNEKVIRK